MRANKTGGDYSKYPEAIREIIPYIDGELCELRSNWEVHKRLFMKNEDFTKMMAESFGPILGIFQNQIVESMFLTIGCLTDRDTSRNKNLSLWALSKACREWNDTVADNLESELEKLLDEVKNIRKHRHKRYAHYDLPTSLGTVKLPQVIYTEIRQAIEKMESLLNEIAYQACDTTILFDSLRPEEITGTAEVSAMKVRAYEDFEQRGVIPQDEWLKYELRDTS